MRFTNIAIAAGCVLVPAAVAVGPHVGELRGSFGVESEFNVDGDVLRGGSFDISDYAGTEATANVNGFAMKDAYDGPSLGLRAELAYGVDDDIEVYGAVAYSKLRGNTVTAGTVTGEGFDPVGVTAEFQDINSFDVEVGARYYVGYGNYRPFFGLNAGLRFANDVRADLSSNGPDIQIRDVLLYDKSTQYSVGLESGIAFGSMDEMISGSLSVGVKYRDSFDADESGLQYVGAGDLLSSDGQIVVPVRGNLSMRF